MAFKPDHAGLRRQARGDAGGGIVRLALRREWELCRQFQLAAQTREVDAGLETLEVDLPAVITTDLRLNEPRYVKLPDIMKAKKKPLETLTLSAIGVEQKQRLKLVKFEPPPQRQKGIRVKDAAELVDALRKKGLV